MVYIVGVLKGVIAKCQPGAVISQLCREADEEILGAIAKVYAKQKNIIKGVAFPTAISINNVLCHAAPMDGEQQLKEGDLAKIELGAHIDGYPALVCHSLVVGTGEVTGRNADLIQAAHFGAEVAIRLLKEGNGSAQVKEAVLQICSDFSVSPIEGMMSHGVGKDNLALPTTIVFRPTDIQAKSLSECDFSNYQVWCVDVAVSLGSGKVAPLPALPTTIYAKNEGVAYGLKLKGSRAVFSEIQTKFGGMAFHLRSLDDQVKGRMALNECVNHQLVQPYEVQGEKVTTDLTARFMFTAIVMPAGPLRLTDPTFDQARIKPTGTLTNPQLKALIEAPVRPTKATKK